MRAYRLLSNILLAALMSACAHSSKTSPGEPRDATRGSSVTAEDIDRAPNVPIEDLLTARVSGVWVARAPDGGLTIRIRGATSVLGSNEPLYIIDDVAVQTGPGGSLTGIAPKDIASIEVLKDAAATAMYGMRGANGVIIIKTKRPNQ